MRTLAQLQLRKPKKNGFSCPPHPLQVLTYIILLYQALVSLVCIGPLVTVDMRVRSK